MGTNMVGLFGAFGDRTHGVAAHPTMRWADDDRTATFADDHVAVSTAFHSSLADDQPVTTSDGSTRVWIQGEVYGVEADGSYEPRPSTVDSTTYCAHLYDSHGIEFVERVNGQFAGVIYDRDERTVHFVTDRLGSYPLFHTRTVSDTVVCSTDIQAMPRYPGVETSYDLDYLAEYLTWKRSFGVTTPLDGVEKLPPASVTTLDLDTMTQRSRCYWRPEYTPVDKPFRYFVERFADIFRRIFDEWVCDDHEYGLLLSGGSDSRLILAAMDRPATCYHMNGWWNREAETAKRVAETADSEFVFLHRDREYRTRALERNPPLSNFDGWFTQGYPTGFADDITDSADVLISGLYSDTLFKSHPISSPRISLGGLGTMTLPMGSPPESIDEFIDELGVETPTYLEGVVDVEEVLRDNITRDEDGIDHHGVRYKSIRELALCSDYYPLSNDTELIYTNSLRQIRPYRTPFLDNRLVDLHLMMPVRYRVRRNIINRAIERLDSQLADVPHSESGVPVKYSFPIEYVGKHTNALRWKVFDSNEPPEPWLTQGPWSNDEQHIRHHDLVGDALDDRRGIIESLPFLDWERVQQSYRDHVAGADNAVELYTLLTMLKLPVTEQFIDGAVDKDDSTTIEDNRRLLTGTAVTFDE
ncbi:asparagine synthase-related protein [Haladaptatus caseinilyticus]|uniref:asparagine synthase-related protein n=1 Tax=Haladaptatus caseinilyticus TaxID=2993314 RepID=UPI00224B9378|nr:asparagine synthase-related protein [Haladaptatus caseinilyticus]